MFEYINHLIHPLIGTNPTEQLTCLQMAMRAFFIFVFGIFLVRIEKRFFGLKTTHDIFLRITIASIFGNIIIGRAPFLDSLVVTFFMVMLNWLVALMSFHWKKMEILFKGSHQILVDNGEIIWKNMRQNLITKDELLETIRLKAHLSHVHEIDKAYLENDGEISIVAFKNNNL